MQHWRRPATDGTEFWISCKRPAFLISFSRLQVIQNKRPLCWAAAYVTAYLEKLKFLIFEGLINSLSGSNCGVVWMQNLKLFSWNGFKLVQTTWSVKQQNWKWSGSIFWKTTFTASLWYHVINWQIDCFSTELPRWIHARTGNNN